MDITRYSITINVIVESGSIVFMSLVMVSFKLSRPSESIKQLYQKRHLLR